MLGDCKQTQNAVFRRYIIQSLRSAKFSICSSETLHKLPIDHFRILSAADNNDNVFSLYSLSLSMKLNIPKCQCSFTLLTTVCIIGGVTSHSLSLSLSLSL